MVFMRELPSTKRVRLGPSMGSSQKPGLGCLKASTASRHVWEGRAPWREAGRRVAGFREKEVARVTWGLSMSRR